MAGGSVVTDLDERGSNGVVHVIDRVLYAPYGNVFTTSRLSPVLSTFTSLVADDEVLSLLFTGEWPKNSGYFVIFRFVCHYVICRLFCMTE